MDINKKKLIQLRTKLEFYKKLFKKLELVLNDKLEIKDWSNEVYKKLSIFEVELDGLKMEMDLPNEEWSEDEFGSEIK